MLLPESQPIVTERPAHSYDVGPMVPTKRRVQLEIVDKKPWTTEFRTTTVDQAGPFWNHQVYCGVQRNTSTGLTSKFFRILHPDEILGFGFSTTYDDLTQMNGRNAPAITAHAFCRKSTKYPYMRKLGAPLIDISYSPVEQADVAFRVKGDQGQTMTCRPNSGRSNSTYYSAHWPPAQGKSMTMVQPDIPIEIWDNTSLVFDGIRAKCMVRGQPPEEYVTLDTSPFDYGFVTSMLMDHHFMSWDPAGIAVAMREIYGKEFFPST